MKKLWKSRLTMFLCVTLLANLLVPAGASYADEPLGGNLDNGGIEEEQSYEYTEDDGQPGAEVLATSSDAYDAGLSAGKSDVTWYELDYGPIECEATSSNAASAQPSKALSRAVGSHYLADAITEDVNISSYYGNQLDQVSKVLYVTLDNMFENVLESNGANTSCLKIFGDIYDFEGYTNDEVIAVADEIKKELSFYVSETLEAYLADNPLYPFMCITYSPFFMWPYDENEELQSGSIHFEFTFKYNDRIMSAAKFCDAERQIEQMISSSVSMGSSRYETLKRIHDFICDTVTRGSVLNGINSTVAGALLEHKADYTGYSRTFKAVCDYFDIPCEVVWGRYFIGSFGDLHMWNVVEMEDGKWYGVDMTWDDEGREPSYDYFLNGSNTDSEIWHLPFGITHQPDMTVYGGDGNRYSKTFSSPVLSEDAHRENSDFELGVSLWETYDPETGIYDNQISALTYSCGNFFWDRQDGGANYDKLYAKFDCQLNSDINALTFYLRLPDGFSFSGDTILSDKTVELTSNGINGSYMAVLEIYPVYSEVYTSETLNIDVEVVQDGEEEGTISLYAAPINYNMNSGQIAFPDFSDKYSASFDAGWFAESAYRYNHELAKLSLALASMEYCSKEEIESSYYNLGFSDVYIYEHYVSETENSNFSIAKKKIIVDGEIVTLLAIPVRGTNDKGNVMADAKFWTTDGIHTGFKNAEDNLKNLLGIYLEKSGVSKENLKYLVTGHSYGAAIANLLGADLNTVLNPSNVYTYTFATPNVTRKEIVSSPYNNIFNIVDFLDVVPSLPPKSMGYGKYGKTYVFANRGSKEYQTDLEAASINYYKYSLYEYNPIEYADYINLYIDLGELGDDTLDVILNTAGLIFSPVDFIVEKTIDYHKKIRPSKAKYLEILKTFYKVWSTIDSIKDVSESIVETGKDYQALKIYISKILQSIACTHGVASYMAWMETISGIPDYTDAVFNWKSLIIDCPVDVELYNSNGELVGRIQNNQVDASIVSNVFMTVAEDTKYAFLPGNDTYSIRIIGTDDGTMNYSVLEYDEDLENVRIVSTSDIEIRDGGVLYGNIDDITGTEIENYTLFGDDQSIVIPEKDMAGDAVYISVSINGNGSVLGTGFYNKGEKVSLKAISDNSVFAGWYMDGKLISSDIEYSFEAADDTGLEAHFISDSPEPSASYYQVIFDSDGGTSVSSQAVRQGEKAVCPEKPVRKGYTFGGWYLGDEVYDFAASVTQDITLTAKWTRISYNTESTSDDSDDSDDDDNDNSSAGHSTNVLPDYVVRGGTWKQNSDGKWQYINGRIYKNEWAALENPYADIKAGQSPFDWFHFDEDGFMQTGWYVDEIGDRYYLNPVSDGTQGRMFSGWCLIDEAWYFFTSESNGRKGALYVSAVTPDGKEVNEKGQYIIDGIVQGESPLK